MVTEGIVLESKLYYKRHQCWQS